MQLSGQTIEGYKILSEIGAGGMGVVYKARDQKLDRLVALKLMHPNLQADDIFKERFWKEARALARLDAPNIVRIHSFLESKHGLMILMEYLEGPDLRQFVNRKKYISTRETIHILRQLLKGVQHAHEANIVHRDIKPQNIIITTRGKVVKITDFGLSKMYDAGEATRTTITGGTLHYMSPEQIHGDYEVDLRTDIYSIGITAYLLLGGSTPFPAGHKGYRLEKQIISGNQIPLNLKNSNLPTALTDTIMKAIDIEPARRFQSAAAFLQALESFQDENDDSDTTKISVVRSKHEPVAKDAGPKVQPTAKSSSKDQSFPILQNEETAFFAQPHLIGYVVMIAVFLIGLTYFSLGKNPIKKGGSELAADKTSIHAGEGGPSAIIRTLMSAGSTDNFLNLLNQYKADGDVEVGKGTDFRDKEGLLIFVVDTERVLASLKYQNNLYHNLATGESIESLSSAFKSKRAIWIKEVGQPSLAQDL